MQLTARFIGDDFIATYSAAATLDDYGVPRSPTFWSIDSISLESFSILDVDMPLEHLPEALEAKLLELAEDLEWEQAE